MGTKQQAASNERVAAIYERVSTRNQGQFGFSLGAQRQSLEEFAAAHGWLLPDHLRFRDGEDDDASGADWDLPGLTAMLDAARAGAFSVLVVPDFDRFARSLVKGLVLEEQLKKYGVRVVYQRVPVEDTPEGRLLKHQLYSFAEYEREKTRLRTITGKRQKAREGYVIGQNRPPLGYRFTTDARGRRTGLEIDPITAPIVRRIFRLLRTRSTVEVADILNSEGLRTPRGKLWSSHGIWLIGISRVYLGEWRWEDPDYGRRVDPSARRGVLVAIPALIDEATWQAVQDALSRRHWGTRRGRVPRDKDTYLLRGLLECGHCHGLVSTDLNGTRRYYTCLRHEPRTARRLGKPVCELPQLLAEPLEQELWDVLSATLLDEDYLQRGLDAAQAARTESDVIRRDRLQALGSEIAHQRRRLDELATKAIDVGAGEFYAALRRQAKEIEALIERLSAERSELAAVRSEGLSTEEAAGIATFAREMRAGIDQAKPSDRRQLYELLDVRGMIYSDPEGIRLGRRTRVRPEWRAAIPLRRGSEKSTTANFDDA